MNQDKRDRWFEFLEEWLDEWVDDEILSLTEEQRYHIVDVICDGLEKVEDLKSIQQEWGIGL